MERDERIERRREQYKPTITAEKEVERRRAALEAQRSEGRQNALSEIRRVALETLVDGGDDDQIEVQHQHDVEDSDVEVEMDQGKQNRHARRKGKGKGKGGYSGRGKSGMDVEAEDGAQANSCPVEDTGEPMGDAEMKNGGRSKRNLRRIRRWAFFARMPMVPDWMIAVPEDLAANWMMFVRPEGERCLLMSDDKSSKIQVRRRNGRVVEVFHDPRFPRGQTILDAVCVEAGMDTKEYYICDVLVWGDVDLANAEVECRHFWLNSRMAEFDPVVPPGGRAIRHIPFVEVSADSLREAYNDDPGYIKDSLVFLHKEGHYIPGTTPLCLAWRDRHISRYVIDTPDVNGETLPEKQSVVLELRGQGFLRTADRVKVAQLPLDIIESSCQPSPKPQALLRCEIDSVDIGKRIVTGLRVQGHAAKKRVWADSFGRIAFQHLHRISDTASVSVGALAQAVV
eukprot:gnl/MRDRNA2_/MRDRNA2_87973_c0_seq1.p1 gnl/MRDRNA2_/MRDRNA2_87973_c0~~gnl/MRDRNA2_/MRDRNA2_87973_c0_seq1.p1  ORF type:complete len:474 (+),score=78.79 gnl/MRDRNA2_/MRDRNA2_87973_c0_seq1:58-1422(+)